jgi:threonylcarbamoyladenosine tRNA methylthiotransferase MtaB
VRRKRIAFHTLGCRVNQYETQALRERMEGLGFDAAGDGEPVDVCVINTCTVTGISDRKSRQLIRRARRDNPGSLLAVIGCYAQTRPDELSAMGGIDILLGSGDKSRLPGLIMERMGMAGGAGAGPGALCDVRPLDGAAYDDIGAVTGMGSRARAFIKIEDGCDRRCAFCVIPQARGPVRSRAPAEILAEAKGLVAGGYRELVLTGVNLALYGSDLSDSERGIGYVVGLLDLLGGDFRVRLGSLEPTVADAAYVRGLPRFGRLCPSLHLSAQSGSTETLRRMGRPYSRDDYLGVVYELRARDPGYGISTDLIAGFPGETEAEHLDSLSLMEAVDFSHVHVFPYSRREGTRAAGMDAQLDAPVRADRARALAAAGAASASAFLERNAGSLRTVLPERRDPATGLLTGLAENGVRAYFEGDDSLCGGFARVRLERPLGGGMLASLLV